MLPGGMIPRTANCGGANERKSVMNIYQLNNGLTTVPMQDRENWKSLQSMRALMQERLMKSFKMDRYRQLLSFQEQNQSLQTLNSELSGLADNWDWLSDWKNLPEILLGYYQHHGGNNEYSYCNLFWRMDKICHSDKPHCTVTIRTVFIYYCCETCPALYYNTYEKVHRNNCYLKNHRHMLSQ